MNEGHYRFRSSPTSRTRRSLPATRSGRHLVRDGGDLTAHARSVHGGLRRENDRIYAEMFKEGIEPFRGTWRSLSVMVVAFLIAVVSMMLGFYVVLGGPVWIFEDILRSITRG